MFFKTKEQPEISDEIVASDPSTLGSAGAAPTPKRSTVCSDV
jgi:hypothetical protein